MPRRRSSATHPSVHSTSQQEMLEKLHFRGPVEWQRLRHDIEDQCVPIEPVGCLIWQQRVDEQNRPVMRLYESWVFVMRVLFVVRGHAPTAVKPLMERWCRNSLCLNTRHLIIPLLEKEG